MFKLKILAFNIYRNSWHLIKGSKAKIWLPTLYAIFAYVVVNVFFQLINVQMNIRIIMLIQAGVYSLVSAFFVNRIVTIALLKAKHQSIKNASWPKINLQFFYTAVLLFTSYCIINYPILAQQINKQVDFGKFTMARDSLLFFNDEYTFWVKSICLSWVSSFLLMLSICATLDQKVNPITAYLLALKYSVTYPQTAILVSLCNFILLAVGVLLAFIPLIWFLPFTLLSYIIFYQNCREKDLP